MLVCSLCGACSVGKYLSADKPLYAGAEVSYENPDQVPDPDALELSLLDFVQQEEASQLGMWWHFKLQSDKEKGVKPWLQRTLGAPPHYYQPQLSARTELLMRDYLKDHGYFGSELTRDTVMPDSTHVRDVYKLRSAGRSRIDTVAWPQDSSALGEFLRKQKPASFAKEGAYYSIAALNAERSRLDRLSSRAGFFEFTVNNLYYIVDSTAGDDLVDVHMYLDEGGDSLAFERYHIGKTYVYPNYTLLDRNDTTRYDTAAFKDDIFVLRNSETRLHAPVLARRIGLREGDLYDEEIYRNTLNQLLDLGVFKYVNYEFKRRVTDSTPVLDQYIYLTQGESQSIGADLETTTRPGSSILGINVGVNHTNANLFNGAEDLRVSANYGIGQQTDITDFNEVVTVSDVSASIELGLPRFLGPGAEWVERTAYYIPRSIARLRYQQTLRPEFDLLNLTAKLGYRYRANPYVTHELYPVNLAYTGVTNPTDTFTNLLVNNQRFAQAFEDNAIAGLEYIYRYNDQKLSADDSFWSIETGVKTSGNLASLFASTNEDTGVKELAGVRLSQYARLYGELRRTWKLSGTTQFASRFYVGGAVPYGNSEVIPYTDQFFAGGPNGIRAFRLRGVGPGAALPPSQDNAQATPLNQSGDIRLELNGEYRFDVAPFVEGAVFTDIGNVWLYNDIGMEAPEGVFEFDKFFQQLAVGLGLGVRFDFEIILIRLDAAAPVRRPWLQGADAWTLKNFNVFDGDLRDRADGPRIHIAIGYPF